MKLSIKKIFTCISLLCISSLVYSQTFENDPETEEVTGEEIIINSENVSPQILSNLGFDTSFSPPTEAIIGNQVFIRQIGSFNEASVIAATENSDIIVNQDGNSNEIDLRYNAQNVFARVNQQGDFNFVSDFVVDGQSSPALDLTQEGNNLSFERFGVNNLTNSLRFNQTEASPAIIVRSYQ